jgi:phosphoserine phosphatase RsbU/P
MRNASLSKLICAGEPFGPEFRAALEASGFAVAAQGLSGIDPAEVTRSQGVVLAVSAATLQTAQSLCRRWRIELGEQYIPLIWIADADVPAQAGLDAGADIILKLPVATDHLVAQVKALLRVQHLNSRLFHKAGESTLLNQKLQQAHQQIDGDLELTRRIHRGFLPRTLPEIGATKFAVTYRPRSRIGGDFYDVFRLDEEHVAFYVADAMGRGLPGSSLLSIFVKKSLAAKDIVGRSYRLVPPNEVLDRLNRDLVGLSLPEPPFVTMVFAQMNCRTGQLTFARAAHPHPLHVPVEGDPVYWHTAGSLLGVFEAEYPLQQHELKPGDKLVLISDGVHPPSSGPGLPNDPLAEAVAKYRHLPVQPFVDQVSRDMLEHSYQPEDFTMLVAEFRP